MTLCDERQLDWDAMIHYAFLLRQKGISGFGVPDLIIAQLSIQYDKYIFSLDHHFENLAKAMPLKILGIA